MSKLLKNQIPELVKQYIKDRFKYLESMFTDERYLKEYDSYNFGADDLEGFLENTRDNMADLRYQMAHYCQLYLTSHNNELEMLAENIRELLLKNDLKSIDNESPAYKALSTKIHDAEVQIFPLEADRLKGGHTYKQEMPKLFPFLENNKNQQPVLTHSEPEDTGILFSEPLGMYAEEHKESNKDLWEASWSMVQ